MDPVRRDIAHLFRRAGFATSWPAVDAAVPAGYPAAVESVLGQLSAADPPGEALGAPAVAPTGRPAGPPGSAARRAQLHERAQQQAALELWWAQRMVATSTPFREKLTLFWHGHFATGYSKVHDSSLMYQQNEVLRTMGGGSFEALTVAVAKGGAMMRWLDTATDKRSHPNENFARELMELFTLGIGNYTQQDVVSAARAFTGWVTDAATGDWHLQARQHDNGIKAFLGTSGDLGGEDVIHVAVTQPASARFVLAKLWSHFAYPVAPSDPVVGDLLAGYEPGLDITGALRAIFLHPAFVSDAARQGLVKQPIEYLVGAARALGLDAGLHGPGGPASGRRPTPLPTLSTSMAQTLFDPPNVGGWGQNAYWLDTATSLARLDAAALMVAAADLSALGPVPAAQRPAAVAELLGLEGWGAGTAAALNHAVADVAALTATALTSPEYVLA